MKQDVNVIFLDNHILVLNKPGGLLTQPSGLSELSLEDLGKKYLKEHFQKPGNVFLEAVHRIDRPASGLVLFARTSKALSRLKEALREGQMSKEYYAVVEGKLSKSEGELEHYLRHDDFRSEVFSHPKEGAKLSRLKYTVLKTDGRCSLLHVFLYTGRYHQIRAQLAATGHPILGDEKYGSNFPSQKLALHHARLKIAHPVTKEMCIFEAPLLDTWPEHYLLQK